MQTAEWILVALILYLAVGALFGLLFVSLAVTRVDPAAAHARWTFRAIIAPGVMLLWPLMARRWWRAAARPVLRGGEGQ